MLLVASGLFMVVQGTPVYTSGPVTLARELLSKFLLVVISSFKLGNNWNT